MDFQPVAGVFTFRASVFGCPLPDQGLSKNDLARGCGPGAQPQAGRGRRAICASEGAGGTVETPRVKIYPVRQCVHVSIGGPETHTE